jgi:hypothetical protein
MPKFRELETDWEFTLIERARFAFELAVESKASVRHTISVEEEVWGTQLVCATSLNVKDSVLIADERRLLLELVTEFR